nr:FeoA family protein [Syntrophotalea carbinolica]
MDGPTASRAYRRHCRNLKLEFPDNPINLKTIVNFNLTKKPNTSIFHEIRFQFHGMTVQPSSRRTGIQGGNKMLKLSMRKMKVNQRGIIDAVRAGGELGKRIRDMGLVPGTDIKIQGRAPLYDPVAIRVMGFTLTLRNNEADYIDVTVED